MSHQQKHPCLTGEYVTGNHIGARVTYVNKAGRAAETITGLCIQLLTDTACDGHLLTVCCIYWPQCAQALAVDMPQIGPEHVRYM